MANNKIKSHENDAFPYEDTGLKFSKEKSTLRVAKNQFNFILHRKRKKTNYNIETKTVNL